VTGRAGAAAPPPREAARALVRRRVAWSVAVPAAVLAYLVYAWFAFDAPGLIARANPERMGLLAVDSMFHKIHVEENLRRGDFAISVEGERNATWPGGEGPDWVDLGGEGRATVDLGEGYRVRMDGPRVAFEVPGFGTIDIDASGETVAVAYPPGRDRPDWVQGDERKFDARPTFDRRVQVSTSRAEVHRYFFGWENFWADFDSPVWGLSWAERLRLIVSAERIDPARGNLRLLWDEFLGNAEWQHARVFTSLFETLLMAVLGTMIAALAAAPLAFLAARNFTPGMAARFATRRLMDFARAVDSLIWSLIFIRAFGLGPLTGSLAIGVTDAGSLGKLFSEALENIDRKQVEGVESTGASRLQAWRFGVIPQILPVLVSQSLYYLESNTRSATVIGALGAGGIGLMLVETMRTARDWENVAYIILLVIGLVVVMDGLSQWLRRRLIEGRQV
jgi:phosphonate transport system permease protein